MLRFLQSVGVMLWLWSVCGTITATVLALFFAVRAAYIPVRQSQRSGMDAVIRIANLGLASYLAMFAFFAVLRTVSGPWNPTGVALTVVIAVWLGAAVGLFFNSRAAWWGSVIGVGTVLLGPLASICEAILLMFLPSDRGMKLQILTTTMSAMMLTLICAPVLAGLLRLRHTLARPLPNTSIPA